MLYVILLSNFINLFDLEHIIFYVFLDRLIYFLKDLLSFSLVKYVPLEC